MQPSRHVRGVLFLDYVRMVRSRRLTDVGGHLLETDRAFLGQRIEPDGWYPMESFERLGLVILDELVGRERDAVRLWGRSIITNVVQFVPSLVARGDARESIVRLGRFLGSLFDFPAIEVVSVSERRAVVQIAYGMHAEAEAAACWQTQGFFEALVQESGGTGLSVELRSGVEGEARSPTVLALEWAESAHEVAVTPDTLPRLLLVDDEPLVLAALERVLRRWGHITKASSVPTALEWLGRASFDVVISDYDLGEANGLTLLETVATRWPAVARILHTAAAPDSARAALARGVIHAVAEKPVEAAELRRVIAEAQKLAAGATER